jgi:predicted small lipoprotein YifL
MKRIIITLLVIAMALAIAGCELPPPQQSGTREDTQRTIAIANDLQANQPTPTDIEYSLERHNLIRRAYWVNGQRERARMLPSPIADMPLGYIVLFTNSGAVIGRFVVEGKVTSLNSFLAPHSEHYEQPYNSTSNGGSYSRGNRWLADVDGAYGENDGGIFFFTPDGRYLEFNGLYLYSDIPFEIDDPIVRIGEP